MRDLYFKRSFDMDFGSKLHDYNKKARETKKMLVVRKFNFGPVFLKPTRSQLSISPHF